MQRFLILGLVAIALAAPSTGAARRPVRGGEGDALTRMLLESDARLQAKVTLAEKERPLGELLADLAKQLKAPLSATRDTADDKVTLFVRDRPAAEVLTLIAQHF